MFFINFAGFFQIRLPTDPDPTDEKRGVSGYSFALADEPDFDRILRLHDPVALRTHAPDVGVFVTSVALGNDILEDHPLNGAKVDFLDEPKFWMLNYIMTLSAGTEALDPFVIQVSDEASGISITRKDFLNPDNPDEDLYDVTLSQMERRGGVLGVPLDRGTFQEITQCDTPKDFRLKRLAALKQDLASEQDPVKRACLETRIGQIEWPAPGDAIAWDDRRTRALQFVERRDFGINGGAEILDPNNKLGVALNESLDWPVQFWNGIWDCDTLCGYMRGTLQIPVKLS